MNGQANGTQAVIKMMFRLLPVQILLASVGAVNGIISSFFASNYVGTDAMSAVGLYAPVNQLIFTISALLSGGSAILCGKFTGMNDREKVQNLFSLNMLIAAAAAVVFNVACAVLALFDWTGFLCSDERIRPLFNTYLLGQSIGHIPYLLGNQLPVYLSMENRQKRTMAASLMHIGISLVLHFLLVQILHLEAFGLALASSLGMWVFFGIQVSGFLGGKTKFRLRIKNLSLETGKEIVRAGFPGAASSGYQTLRGLIVNNLLTAFVGSIGVSAFAAANSLLGIFWAIPKGMLAVSRLMIGVSVGEEDQQTLEGVMRNLFRRFIPLMFGIGLVIILLAEPFTRLFYRDPSDPVYRMTVWGFRILPLSMPLTLIYSHFTCYSQAVGHQVFVNVLALLDGLVCSAAFSALLIRPMGINGVYTANILNGIVCALVIFGYAWVRNKRFPKTVGDLLVLPEGFGAEADARIDISVRNMEEVLTVSREVTDFCKRRGIDKRRSYIAGLCLEEMAGNIVEHGFAKDEKKHLIDIRVVHKNDDMILRIRDDCVPFDPGERNGLTDSESPFQNIGIKMVYKAARNVEYQSVLGMNVLTMRI